MPPLSLLIKPASGNCNLRCKYCFYHSITDIREIESFGIMDEKTLELLIKKAFDYAQEQCTFAFQGGEPTLAGLEFFEKLIELQNKYNKNNIKVNNTLQTNGIIIDEKWAEFLKNNNFLVGLSLDGPKNIHDYYRVDSNNKGSFTRVMNTVKLFDKFKVEYNILFVVNADVARHVNKVYNYFKKNNFKYIQFIPCLDPLNEEPGKHKYSLTPERYSYFLRTLFDRWYNDIKQGDGISIRYFDNVLGMVAGYPPEACGMIGECSCQFVVEADGSVYPCDFYVLDEWCLGNLKDKSLEELQKSETAREFIEVSKYILPECKQCEWYGLCRGGCRRSREPFVDNKPVLNYYCTSQKEFFEHSIEKIQEILRLLQRR